MSCFGEDFPVRIFSSWTFFRFIENAGTRASQREIFYTCLGWVFTEASSEAARILVESLFRWKNMEEASFANIPLHGGACGKSNLLLPFVRRHDHPRILQFSTFSYFPGFIKGAESIPVLISIPLTGFLNDASSTGTETSGKAGYYICSALTAISAVLMFFIGYPKNSTKYSTNGWVSRSLEI